MQTHLRPCVGKATEFDEQSPSYYWLVKCCPLSQYKQIEKLGSVDSGTGCGCIYRTSLVVIRYGTNWFARESCFYYLYSSYELRPWWANRPVCVFLCRRPRARRRPRWQHLPSCTERISASTMRLTWMSCCRSCRPRKSTF